jgi:hypothetical protein
MEINQGDLGGKPLTDSRFSEEAVGAGLLESLIQSSGENQAPAEKLLSRLGSFHQEILSGSFFNDLTQQARLRIEAQGCSGEHPTKLE